MRRLGREPLLHFAALGALVFVLHGAFNPGPHHGMEIKAEVARAIVAETESRLGRPATPEEREAALQAYVDRELMVREALALGLHRTDPVVRRRLAQKMHMIHEDTGIDDEPTRAELEAWVADHPGRFARAGSVDLEHVFFSRDRHEAPGRKALDVLSQLEALDDAVHPQGLGDAFVHGPTVKGAGRGRLESVFGPSFASAVGALPVGRWAVLDSTAGAHVVRVTARRGGRIPDLDVIHAEVASDLRESRRVERAGRAMDKLRQRSTWSVEEER